MIRVPVAFYHDHILSPKYEMRKDQSNDYRDKSSVGAEGETSISQCDDGQDRVNAYRFRTNVDPRLDLPA